MGRGLLWFFVCGFGVFMEIQGFTDSGHLYRIVLSFNDLDRVSSNHKTRPRFGDDFHVLQNQAIECSWAIYGQIPAQASVDFTNMGVATDQIATVFLRMNVLVV